MAVNNKSIWPYIISRLMAIVIVVVPILTGIFTATIQKIKFPNEIISFGSRAYLAWALTLFYCTWSFFLLILLPYGWIYVHKQLKEKDILRKFLLFYGLLLIMGLLLPEASVIDLFNDPFHYPAGLILYLLLTITICPLCNLALNRVV